MENEIKSIAVENHITDVDKHSGRVSGYFSIFGNIDSDGDMIQAGSFKRTLQNQGERIRHLWQHDVKFPLAIPQLKEDSTGLHFDSVISRTSYGRDVLQLYLDGICNEHSIGFNSIQKSAKKGYNEITEIRLWEGSSVTWGSNQFAIGSVEKSQQRMDILLKAYKNGRYENEDIFLQIENSIKQLTQTANTQPAPKAPVSNANDAALLLIKQQIDKFYGDKYRNQTGFGAIEQGCCGAGGCA